MTDDLVKAVARAWASIDGKPYGNKEAEAGGYTEGYDTDAEELLRRSGLSDRIEELEAKLSESEALLAKAVEALETIAKPKVGPDFDWTEDEVNKWRAVWYRKYADTARTTLAELTGGKDE